MNKEVFLSKRIQNFLIFCSILSAIASETWLLQTRAESPWDKTDVAEASATSLIWKTNVESDKIVDPPPMAWDKVQKDEKDSHQPSTSLV